MKKFLFLIICLSICGSAFADYPENEAEFLYNHKDNSSVRYNYLNEKNYIKTSNDTYIRNDGVTIYKNPAGFIETSTGKSYMPVGSGDKKMYIPMDL